MTFLLLRNKEIPCRSNAIPFFDLTPWQEVFNEKLNTKTNTTKNWIRLPDVPSLPYDPLSLSELPSPIKEEVEEEEEQEKH